MKQKIKVETDGTYKGTKLFVNENQIQFQTIQIDGANGNDIDVIVGLCTSKNSKGNIKKISNGGGECTPAVGFALPHMEFEDEDE